MADTQEDFLAQMRYEPGEVERLEVLWDTAVAKFAGYLLPAVGETLREEIRSAFADVPSSWITSAKETIALLLPTFLQPESNTQVDAEMTTDLRQSFWSVGAPDQAAIEAEIGATCRELAQQVLTQWFEVLTQARRTGQAVSLNASMLPDGLSHAQMVSGINLATYAATLPTVATALRVYQSCLYNEFKRNHEPITFGTRLLVVPVADQPPWSFQLFAEEGRAREVAAQQAAAQRAMHRKTAGASSLLPSTPASWPQLLARVRDTIREELSPMLPAAPLPVRQALWTASRAAAGAPSPLGPLVDLGLDAVYSGLAIGPAMAKQHLQGQVELITEALTAQAQDIDISLAALQGVYTFVLQSALEIQRPSAETLNAAPEALLMVQNQFRHTFGVSPGQAQILAQTAALSLRPHTESCAPSTLWF